MLTKMNKVHISKVTTIVIKTTLRHVLQILLPKTWKKFKGICMAIMKLTRIKSKHLMKDCFKKYYENHKYNKKDSFKVYYEAHKDEKKDSFKETSNTQSSCTVL